MKKSRKSNLRKYADMRLNNEPGEVISNDRLHRHINWLAQDERNFGPATALEMFGQVFPSSSSVPLWLRPGTPKQCFVNATAIALSRDDAVYAEGYALCEDVPVPLHHAWVINRRGAVIETTWELGPSHCYLGIPFKTDFVAQVLLEDGQCGLLDPPLMRRRASSPDQFRQIVEFGFGTKIEPLPASAIGRTLR
ncbi:hypothetical protein [Rhizobium sp. 11515TR]|uniref:hypothetical protein n=1 Tax=Rhizobium sp. 11515TR TaxID=2028343 RepID=UPI000BA83A2B|nr:hypothetical protein [Rhizobium sp. 11515TR]ASW08638.1 hypothetical protein CKA34_21850 [Rhizobium sp. 11515TR]